MSNDDALLRAGHRLIDSLEAAGAVFDDRGTARNYQSHVVRRLPGSDVNLINETGPALLEPIRRQFARLEQLLRPDNPKPGRERLCSVVQIIKVRLKASGVIRDDADESPRLCGFPRIERSSIKELESLLKGPVQPVFIPSATARDSGDAAPRAARKTARTTRLKPGDAAFKVCAALRLLAHEGKWDATEKEIAVLAGVARSTYYNVRDRDEAVKHAMENFHRRCLGKGPVRANDI